ncbi:hypothetical protein [Pseudomonas sp. W03]|uniref:hypothetical protein n=1 Tax=Pseudomonas sp. W03 TaxID=3090666 RepID=UPI003A4D3FB7
MQLIAYWVGGNVVAAGSSEGAVAVMDQHEAPGRWSIDNVQPLTPEELGLPVEEGGGETFAEALARCQAESPAGRPGSRLAQVRAGEGRAQLILWDYPGA